MGEWMWIPSDNHCDLILAPHTGRVIYHTFVVRLQPCYNNQCKQRPFLISHYIPAGLLYASVPSPPIYPFKLSLQPPPAWLLRSMHEGHVPSQDPWQKRLKSQLGTCKSLSKNAPQILIRNPQINEFHH